MRKVFHVTGMTCGGCVRAVTDAIKAKVPSAKVEVDLPNGIVTVESADPGGAATAIMDAGFEITAPT